MNTNAFENFGKYIAKGWIISCSILTFGMITCAYLNRNSKLIISLPNKKVNDWEIKKTHQIVSFLAEYEDKEEEFNDEDWVAKKKEFWKKNNITPIKINCSKISPLELAQLLNEKFGKF